jgi:Glycoside-hydrolase family GH114
MEERAGAPGLGAGVLVGVLALVASCGEARGTLVTTTFHPAAGASWQVQLTGTLDTSVDASLYDVDAFDTPTATIEALHAAGRRVICYLSVGTDESWRADAMMFPAAAVGNQLARFPNERWLDTRDATVRALMAARLDGAAAKGCDGIDFSNVSPDAADTGFPLTHADVLAFARAMAGEAHRRGLGAGLGGGTAIAADAVGAFDWAFSEGCVTARTCADFAAFLGASKVVLGVEFGAAGDADTICPAARSAGIDVIIKNPTYDAFRVSCP